MTLPYSANIAMANVQVQVPADSDDELENRLCTKGLKVVEIYAEWAGPCRSVLPTFRRIRIERDDESSLLFVTCCAEKVGFLEAAKEHRGKSEPLFLLYRNGQLKAKVIGANTPMLASLIYEQTPANAEMDDLEENPLYLAKRDKERVAKGEKIEKGKKKK